MSFYGSYSSKPRFQGCLLGLIFPHVDIEKVKICIWVMSAESKKFKGLPSSVQFYILCKSGNSFRAIVYYATSIQIYV